MITPDNLLNMVKTVNDLENTSCYGLYFFQDIVQLGVTDEQDNFIGYTTPPMNYTQMGLFLSGMALVLQGAKC